MGRRWLRPISGLLEPAKACADVGRLGLKADIALEPGRQVPHGVEPHPLATVTEADKPDREGSDVQR